MDATKEVGDRVQALARRLGGSKPMTNKKLAEFLEVSPTTAHRIRKGDWPLPGEVADVLAKIGGKIVFDETSGPEYAFLQLCEAKPSAGPCSLETSSEAEKTLAFRRDWLSSKTITSDEKLCLMRVKGDSMLPTIADGDTILVDAGDICALREGRVYVVRKGESIYVKRFRQGVDKYLFMGDNRDMDYQDLAVDMRHMDGFAVIGRVIWVGREL